MILQPVFGKTNYDTCRLKVLMKDFVYVTHNGNLNSEPADTFKQWMTKHDYDPEHGKDTPTQTAPAASASAGTPVPQTAPPPPQ